MDRMGSFEQALCCRGQKCCIHVTCEWLALIVMIGDDIVEGLSLDFVSSVVGLDPWLSPINATVIWRIM